MAAGPRGASPTEPGGAPASPAPRRGWAYFGVGCFTFFPGLFGGAMIAVLVAKVVGGVTRCAPQAETGAPCNWGPYAMVGGLIGALLLPGIALWRMRRSK